MRNFLDKSCIANQNTFYVHQLSSENRAIYEITAKDVVEPEGPKMTSQYGANELHAG
jgi:hypothetical protein